METNDTRIFTDESRKILGDYYYTLSQVFTGKIKEEIAKPYLEDLRNRLKSFGFNVDADKIFL